MFEMLKHLKIESKSLDKIAWYLRDWDIKGKAIVITEKNIDKIYGEQIRSQLYDLYVSETSYIEQNSIEAAMKLGEHILSENIDYIVGFGGGRVLDTCKYASYISKRRLISIPTAVSNDGIASPIAVLKKQDGIQTSLGSVSPYAMIIDTDIISNSPISLIKAGIGDTISNYTALSDWKNASEKGKDTMHDIAYLMSSTALDVLLNSQFKSISERFIENLVQSLVLSGIAMKFAGTSRPCSGPEHLFSHALDFYCSSYNLHGLQVALGSIIMSKLQGLDYSFLIEYLDRFEVGINPRELNISEVDFIYCIKEAKNMRLGKYTFLSEENYDDTLLTELYQEICSELKIYKSL